MQTGDPPTRDSTTGTTGTTGRPGGELRSVANALRLLSQLAQADGSLGVTELSRVLGVAPSTTYRLLSTLAAHGFATRLPDERRYRRGPELARAAGRYRLVEYVRLREIAHPLLERLADRTGESTHLAVLDEPDVVGIDHVESSKPVLVVRHPVGSRVPAHATAVGQALLAYLPDAAEMVISAGLELHTGETISDPDAFRRTLAEVRDRGYAINVRQWYAETSGVAAPVRAPDGEVLAALGISGPTTRVNGHRLLAELGVEARAAADEIALRLARRQEQRHG
jgi:DNA-binding IclR family transcriptional regulator